MVLQAKMYQKEGSPKEEVKSFFKSAQSDITHPKLKEIFTKIIEEE